MQSLIKIEQLVPIEFKYLDKDIKQHMLRILREAMNKCCSSTYGYITEVKKIIEIGENKISPSNSLVIFKIVYEADVLKPFVGNIISGTVSIVLQNGDGIMVNICNKIQVLIPSSNMKPFLFNQSQLLFEYDSVKIQKGCQINLEIVASKYEKKQYKCIAKIKI